MATYILSFRIADKTVGGKSYEERYTGLLAAVKGVATGKYWEQTTAFILFRSSAEIGRLIAVCQSAISKENDLVLVFDPEQQEGRITGPNPDQDIFELLPYVKKA